MKGTQNGPFQLGHGIVEASRHQEAFEPAPQPLYRVQVRAVGRQPVQPQPLRLPRRLALSDDPGSVKRSVVQDRHARLGRRSSLGQSIQVADNLLAVARTLQYPILQPLGSPLLQAERADEVDAPLGAPPPPHRMLVGLALFRPGVRRGQAQVEAALVEVLQDDLSFRCPFLSPCSSSLALRSSSGSGGLFGT